MGRDCRLDKRDEIRRLALQDKLSPGVSACDIQQVVQ